jgi:hypothetical protein
MMRIWKNAARHLPGGIEETHQFCMVLTYRSNFRDGTPSRGTGFESPSVSVTETSASPYRGLETSALELTM